MIIFPAISLYDDERFLNSEYRQCRKFLATEAMLTATFKDGVRGVRADSQRFWLIDGRIFFEMKEPVATEGEVYTTSTEQGDFSFQLIEPDAMMDIFTKNIYFDSTQYHGPVKTYLAHRTTAGKAEALERANAIIRAQTDMLNGMGVEVNDNTLALLGKVLSFDYTYDYSDDHKFCIKYRQYERELDAELAAYPALVQLKSDSYVKTFSGNRS